MALGAAGCLSDAIKQNQQQLDQQKAELDQLKQQVADLQGRPAALLSDRRAAAGLMRQGRDAGGDQARR